ncbi:MAG: serine/threonine protein kinase [Symploca sp. SIO2G7]|nr:serine/threonine protein kinase [Symploca sp. SIO2G7]
MAFTIGQKLRNGSYTIERELGLGEVAITYLAQQRNSGRIVIKTLKDDLLSQLQPSERERLKDKFWQEATKLANCRHSHIVSVKEPFKEGELVCIPMEYIDGPNLASFDKIWKEQEALPYIQQIGEALIEVHRQGLVHRDVKPRHIMLRQGKSEAVLTDFALAREFEHPLSTVSVSTTDDGFSPIELYHSGTKPGPYTDVYSLAATLYFLLTNKLPLGAVQRSHPLNRLIPPKEINPYISDRINQAIIKGMALEADARPQSMQEWLKSLGLRHTLALPKWNLMTWLTVVATVAGVIATIVAIIDLFQPDSPSSPESTGTPQSSFVQRI